MNPDTRRHNFKCTTEMGGRATGMIVHTHTSDATQLIASVQSDPIGVAVVRQAEGEHINDVPELVTPTRLDPTHVIAIRQAEAARGKPRSLHNIARDALNIISKRENYGSINLDGCFPWRQYVAAHAQSSDIIGPGITHAEAVFVQGTRDTNRGGMPRLDFFFYRSDGTCCRIHPGSKPKADAQLIFEDGVI